MYINTISMPSVRQQYSRHRSRDSSAWCASTCLRLPLSLQGGNELLDSINSASRDIGHLRLAHLKLSEDVADKKSGYQTDHAVLKMRRKRADGDHRWVWGGVFDAKNYWGRRDDRHGRAGFALGDLLPTPYVFFQQSIVKCDFDFYLFEHFLRIFNFLCHALAT